MPINGAGIASDCYNLWSMEENSFIVSFWGFDSNRCRSIWKRKIEQKIINCENGTKYLLSEDNEKRKQFSYTPVEIKIRSNKFSIEKYLRFFSGLEMLLRLVLGDVKGIIHRTFASDVSDKLVDSVGIRLCEIPKKSFLVSLWFVNLKSFSWKNLLRKNLQSLSKVCLTCLGESRD